jgi:FHA domain
MAACPHCQSPNPDRAVACGRCGRVLTGRAAITVPLPAPMTEPIRTPSKSQTDGRPPPAHPVLTLPLGEKSAVVTADPPERRETNPDPLAVREVSADVFPTHDAGPTGGNLGTIPAQPGLPGHPMNDAALQNPPHTVPATAPADESPSPIPPAPPGKPRLVVLRGLKINAEYPIYEGRNTIGRFADKPVDIDLVSQESVEQIWCSRQHAVITFDRGVVVVEDLNSLNGTWVNGSRIHPGQYHQLKQGDVIQVGTVQLKLVFA